VRGLYRHHLLVKTVRRPGLEALVADLKQVITRTRGVRVTLDVDPSSLL
jgi:primosomal protein N'